LDVLVNNVGGGWITQGFADLDDESWSRMLDLNLMTAVRTSRAALPALTESRGVVVNVSSINGHLPSPWLHVYTAAKAGLDALTSGLAHEYAPRGVRVVGVAPGPVDTSLWHGDDGVGAAVAEMTGRSRDEVVESARAEMPFGRFASPEEVADLIAFLASPRAASISGTTVRIDGAATPTV
jgi:NAD(P)-dependent dehydrogenase (short-subunit alcohol dehydrogenase family)